LQFIAGRKQTPEEFHAQAARLEEDDFKKEVCGVSVQRFVNFRLHRASRSLRRIILREVHQTGQAADADVEDPGGRCA
jgi:hypothetical protein